MRLPQRARSFIDLAASIAVLVAAGIVTWQATARYRGTEARTKTIAVPSQPMKLDGAVLAGGPTAKVGLIEFSDFECPYCGKFVTDVLPRLTTHYVAKGLLMVVFKNFPLTQIHQNAQRAAEAAACAREQGRFEKFHNLLFANPKSLVPQYLTDSARDSGVEMSAFQKCLDGTAAALVKEDVAVGNALGITSTPAFFVGSVLPNGSMRVTSTMAGTRPIEDFVKAIDEALKQSK